VPALFRIHQPPTLEKAAELKELMQSFGYAWIGGKQRELSKAFQAMQRQWQAAPEAELLNKSLLRSMQLAVYHPRNTGHFGLASGCYTHFTSPIRRYPDLLAHRALAAKLADPRYPGAQRPDLEQAMLRLGESLSAAERVAEKVERVAVKIKQVEFLLTRLGGRFAGKISGVTTHGFFVELDEVFVEGFVRISDIQDDYYHLDPLRKIWRGEAQGREFAFAQRLEIVVAEVNMSEVFILFHLADAPPVRSKIMIGNRPRVAPRRRSQR
jgi:ribonuclease R